MYIRWRKFKLPPVDGGQRAQDPELLANWDIIYAEESEHIEREQKKSSKSTKG